jgi:enolase
MNLTIKSLHAREVLDSRGNPTVEVEMISSNGKIALAIVPSGASTGVHEAMELRDGDKSRYLGKGVLKAVKNVNEIIASAVIGMDLYGQKNIDSALIALDGTENKGKLGANAILAVSMAAMRLSAIERDLPLFKRIQEIAKYQLGAENVKDAILLPTPMMNIINGGAHADSGLNIQEFMILPTGATSFREALRMGAEVFHNLKKILANKGFSTSVGDEGGFAPHLPSNESALQVILEAIEAAGHNGKIELGMDCAASEFYENGKYKIDGKSLSGAELVEYYAGLFAKYPIVSIEDGADDDDW